MTKVQPVVKRLQETPALLDADMAFGEVQVTEERTTVLVAEILYCSGAVCAASGSEIGAMGGLKTRPLAMIEVDRVGLRVTPQFDRRRLAVAASLLGAWIGTWLTWMLKAIFASTEPS